MSRWASIGLVLLLMGACFVSAQEMQPTPSEQPGAGSEPPPAVEEPSPLPTPEIPISPPESQATPEELFDPEELIRADEEPPTPTPQQAAEPVEAPTETQEASEPEPTPGVAVDSNRLQDLASMEAQAEGYFKSMNYTRPPRNNVLDISKEILKQDSKNAKVRELVGKMAAHYKNKGEASLKARQWAAAIDQFKRLQQIDLFGENKAYAQSKIEEAKQQQGNESAVQEKPEVLLKKAESAFGKKDYQTARKYYQAILQQIPDDILARKGFEKCNQLLGIEPEGSPQERISYFRQAGETFLEMENFQEAKFYYEKILTIDANDEDARGKLGIIQDKMTPKGKLVIKFEGEPFWWQTKVDGRLTDEEAKAYIELVIKVDGETAYYRTDSDIEEAVKSGKKGHAKNVYKFQDDYTFDNIKAGPHTIEVILRGGAGEEAGQWSSELASIKIEPGTLTEMRFKTEENLKYNKRKSRMSGEFKIQLIK